MKSSSRSSVNVAVGLPVRAINYSNATYSRTLSLEFGAGNATEGLDIEFEDTAQLKEFMRVLTLVTNELANQPDENYISHYASE